ncbi:MAG: hypothetical protein Q9N26_02980 [Aquificota bacterium]|nr:hypothetical protein [Aquificota bacterium]
MKALLLLYSKLIHPNRSELYRNLERNMEVLNRIIGIDSIYASISSHFKDLFDKFPEVCFVNNLRDTSVFGAYKGLRKLRGNDVLLLDGGVKVTRDLLLRFIDKVHVTVGVFRERWAGIALVKMRDLDYVVRSLEKNFEGTMMDAFRTLKETYSIVTEFLDLEEDSGMVILDIK